jgi:hypothetical protein
MMTVRTLKPKVRFLIQGEIEDREAFTITVETAMDEILGKPINSDTLKTTWMVNDNRLICVVEWQETTYGVSRATLPTISSGS